MNYYLYPPFFIVDPQNSFDEAWEVFCCEMLNLENNTNLIRRRRPPDLGADLIWDSEKIIYQCKSVSTGEYGKFDLTKAKESIDKAIENQAHLNWERYVLCTNVDLTGDQERKLKEYLPCIEFRTKGYWINLCKKFSESVSSRFRFLSDTSYTLKFWNMPYYRNPYFNGRENILTTIYARWHKPSATSIFRRQALYGLGGIGKTQIAIEYAYRYREVYSAVFWCRAASQETLTTDLLKIAEVLHISNKTSYNASTNQPQIIAEVKNWFIRNKDWLIIFDNVEDVNLIFDFLPTEENGYVLVTTRDQFIAHVVSSIEVEKLDNENGILLLLRRAKIISQEEYPLTIAENDLQIADTLVTLMDGLPLAIDQAGAYILEVKCSLPHYHKLYQMNQIEFLKRRSSLLNEYPESVMTTWSISFKEVEKISLASAELLRLCAFLEPDFIPEEMMIDGLKQIEKYFVESSSKDKSDIDEKAKKLILYQMGLYNQNSDEINVTDNISRLRAELQSIDHDPFAFDGVIGNLLRFSLIKRHNDIEMISIHRLVQVALMDGIPEDVQWLWAIIVLETININLPYTVRPETWIQCQRYLTQASACWNLVCKYLDIFALFKNPLLLAARFFNTMGNYLHEQGYYKQARLFFEQGLELFELAEGENSINVAIMWHQLARLSFAEGKYDEAEALFHRTIDFYHHVQLSESRFSDALMTFHELSRLSIAQKKFSKAHQIINYTLKMRKSLLGEEHRDTATTMHELAVLYREQEHYEKAASTFENVLTIEEKVLGKNHVDVASTLSNLGETYFLLNKLQEALSSFKRALNIFIYTGNENHINMIETAYYLGRIYEYLKQFDKSIDFYERYYRIIREIDIESSSAEIEVLEHILLLCAQQNMLEKTEEILYKILELFNMNPNMPSERHFYALHSLAKLYNAQKKHPEALKIYHQAMKLLEDKSFPETCGEAFFLFDFAEAYIISEQEEKALPLLERSVNIYMREVGIEHPFTKAVIERYHWLKKHIQSRKQFSSKQKKRPVKGRKRRH